METWRKASLDLNSTKCSRITPQRKEHSPGKPCALQTAWAPSQHSRAAVHSRGRYSKLQLRNKHPLNGGPPLTAAIGWRQGTGHFHKVGKAVCKTHLPVRRLNFIQQATYFLLTVKLPPYSQHSKWDFNVGKQQARHKSRSKRVYFLLIAEVPWSFFLISGTF